MEYKYMKRVSNRAKLLYYSGFTMCTMPLPLNNKNNSSNDDDKKKMFERKKNLNFTILAVYIFNPLSVIYKSTY